MEWHELKAQAWLENTGSVDKLTEVEGGLLEEMILRRMSTLGRSLSMSFMSGIAFFVFVIAKKLGIKDDFFNSKQSNFFLFNEIQH